MKVRSEVSFTGEGGKKSDPTTVGRENKNPGKSVSNWMGFRRRLYWKDIQASEGGLEFSWAFPAERIDAPVCSPIIFYVFLHARHSQASNRFCFFLRWGALHFYYSLAFRGSRSHPRDIKCKSVCHTLRYCKIPGFSCFVRNWKGTNAVWLFPPQMVDYEKRRVHFSISIPNSYFRNVGKNINLSWFTFYKKENYKIQTLETHVHLLKVGGGG